MPNPQSRIDDRPSSTLNITAQVTIEVDASFANDASRSGAYDRKCRLVWTELTTFTPELRDGLSHSAQKAVASFLSPRTEWNDALSARNPTRFNEPPATPTDCVTRDPPLNEPGNPLPRTELGQDLSPYIEANCFPEPEPAFALGRKSFILAQHGGLEAYGT